MAGPTPRGGLADWRNRLLGNPRFIRWAQRTPLVRRLARRRAAALFATVAGFVNSQVLLACVELGLFEELAEGPREETTLAQRLRLEPERLRVLLRAAAALQLAEDRGAGRWGLGPLGSNVLGDPSIAALVRHHRILYRDLEDPVGLLRDPHRSTGLAGLWPYAGAGDPGSVSADSAREYTALMAASQQMIAWQVLQAFDFRGFDRLLDVGGGDGSFLAAVGQRHPALRLALFDLPGVVAHARETLERAGLSPRTDLFEGDFHRDPLPGGQSLISLVRVLHDHDDAPAGRLLAAARRALNPNGRLLVAEPMRDTPGAEAMGGAYFGFYLLAMGSGRPRSPAELRRLLADSGFVGVRHHPTPLPLVCSVLSAGVGTSRS